MGPSFYISADLEGACGICLEHQVFPRATQDKTAYRMAVAQLTQQLRWVVDALLRAFPETTRIVVNDSHASMGNLALWADAPAQLQLISGKPKRFGMMAGLDNGFTGVLLVGYHAKAGTARATLCHSFTDAIHDIRLNGVSVGEAGLNAALAWKGFGVPVWLALGDEALARELQAFAPSVSTVTTKDALGWASARYYAEESVQLKIEQAVAQRAARFSEGGVSFALPEAVEQASNYTLSVTLKTPLQADIAELLPGASRQDGYTIALEPITDIRRAYLTFQALYSLLAYEKTLNP